MNACTGVAGFEPATYHGVKVRCLEPLGDTPKLLHLKYYIDI